MRDLAFPVAAFARMRVLPLPAFWRTRLRKIFPYPVRQTESFLALMGEPEPGVTMVDDPIRVKEIFLEAVEQPGEAARAAYLDRACGEDAALRDRVEALLRSHNPAGSFLGTPAAALADSNHTETVALDPSPVRNSTHDSDDPRRALQDEELRSFLAPSTRPDSLGRLGHYEALQVLGQGGFGIVFRAFDDVLQRVVAVKVLAPHMAATSPARKRFLREARSSAAVRHENVVQVYEVAEQPLPYLVMEFIPGETLQQRLDRIGPLDVSETLRIGRQIAEGLAAAHASDLIHRDIKPGNVLLEGGSQKVKITDFGLARAADDASMSKSGTVAGTPMYMAPEQVHGETLDQRADLFSLGSVVYQMVSGRPPFRANNTMAVLKRVAEDTPRPIREIIPETPQWLCEIIAKLHAKNPDDRYKSAREVADVLADCEAQLKTNSRLKDFSRIPRGKRPSSGNWKWAAAAVLLLTLLGLAVTDLLGLTRMFLGRPATTNPIQPGNGPDRIADATPQERIALEFDGDADYVATPLVYDGSTPLTVEATVQISEWPVHKKHEHSEIVSSTQLGGFSVGTAKKGFYISARVGEGYVSVYSSQDDQYLNRPIKLAGIIDGKALRLYIDGKQVGQTAFEHQFKPGTQKISLGTSPGDGTPHDSGGYEWAGKMYEVRISNIARYKVNYDASASLTADEHTMVLYRFDEGSGDILNDSSGNRHHGKIVGAKWANTKGAPIVAAQKTPDASEGVGPAIVHGVITNEAGIPFHRAHVYLSSKTRGGGYNGKTPQAYSDDQGRYSITTSDPENCSYINVHPPSRSGYEYSVRKLSLKKGDKLQANFGLFASKSVTIEYVYQPNGTRSFKQGTKRGTIVLERPNFGIIFSQGVAHATITPDDLRFEAKDGQWQFKNFHVSSVKKSGFYDAGAVPLDGVAEAAETGYTNSAKPSIVGHTYVVRRLEGHYVKFIVKSIGAPSPAAKAPPLAKQTPDAAGWIQLFNGKDLTGWKTHPDQPGNWTVESGELVGRGGTSNLFTDRGSFRNFHIRLEAKLNVTGDSGVFFRSEYGVSKISTVTGMKYPQAYEAQIRLDFDKNNHPVTGSLFSFRSVRKTLTEPDQWLQMEVIAVDNHFVIKVNGQTTVDFRDTQDRYQGGHIALQCGGGGAQTVVHFRKIELKELPPTSLPPMFKNSIGMEFVIVPKGKSWLGGGNGKLSDKEVEIPADFYLGKYEVTQEEWEKVMGENPSHFSRKGGGMDAVKDISDADLKRFPVENVSWDQCQLFVEKLNKLEKETGWVYRLPRSAEWEYACRGGAMADRMDSAFDFYFDKPTNTLWPQQVNFNNGLKRTCKVGSYAANRLGLYDMHGNVLELCDNAFDAARMEPRYEWTGGGSWKDFSRDCRTAFSRVAKLTDRYDYLGLRLARVPSVAPSPEAKTPPLALAPFTDADVQRIGALPAADQVEEVRKELVRRNPDFDGTVMHKIEDGVVTELQIVTDHVTDIAPIRVWGALRVLKCGGTWTNGPSGQLADLMPLGRMTTLTHLNLMQSKVTDAGIACLKNCKDLSYINLNNTRVTNKGLAHLKDSQALAILDVSATKVTDEGLAHIKDCRALTHLLLGGTKVSDAGLANLKGIPLIHLWIDNTDITDLTPLQGMRLEEIRLTPKKITRGLDILRDMKSLKTIGTDFNQSWAAAEFWKRYDKGEFKE